MTITIPDNRTIPLEAKAGGGFRSVGLGGSGGESWTEGQVPEVTGFSGSLASGTFTITGSNFSVEAYQNAIYDDFDGGAVGQDVSGWEQDSGVQHYVYESSGAASIHDRFARCAVSYAGRSYCRKRLSAGSGFKEVMVLWRERINIIDPGGQRNLKLGTILGGADHSDHDSFGPRFIHSMINPGTVFAQTISGNPTGQTYWVSDPANNQWQVTQKYLRLDSSPGAGDGKKVARTGNDLTAEYSGAWIGRNGGSTPDWAWDSDDMTTYDQNSEYDELNQFWLPFYQRTDMDTVVDISEVAIIPGRECVILSPASTWTDTASDVNNFNKIAWPQIQSSDNEQTTCKSELGPHLATGPVYAYRMNQDGLVNENGFLVRAS